MRCMLLSTASAIVLLPLSTIAQEFSLSEDEFAQWDKSYSPHVADHCPQNVYLGDTHFHTSWSADAGMAGATLGPDAAYGTARGEEIESWTGQLLELIRPLDFVVVADHAGNIGFADHLKPCDPLLLETETGQRWLDYFEARNGLDAAYEWSAANAEGRDPISSPEMTVRVWDEMIENAERYNDPGVFTAFADFEIIDASNLTGTVPKEPEMLKTEYARVGVNPFTLGMIGSTDGHNTISSTREENWFGKICFVEPFEHSKDGVIIESALDPKYAIDDIDLGASGLAAVWAMEKTRESIWNAMKRREVFATTGSGLRVRVFGGWDVAAEEVSRPDLAAQGYARGVPMGGDLRAGPEGAAPSFMVRALCLPNGANLDRIQIIKGWLDANGETRERIWDIACADASWTNTIGRAVPGAHWPDPAFNPSLKALYDVRVIEVPTPRWTAYDAKFFDIEMPENARMIVQHRAYISPIWYTPAD